MKKFLLTFAISWCACMMFCTRSPQFELHSLSVSGAGGSGGFTFQIGDTISCVYIDSTLKSPIMVTWVEPDYPLVVQLYHNNHLVYPANPHSASASGVTIPLPSDSLPYEFKAWDVGGTEPIIEDIWYKIGSTFVKVR